MDRNTTEGGMADLIGSRSLRGNVDRNADKINALNAKYQVVPYVGTWIEIISISGLSSADTVVPYVGTWIEITEGDVPLEYGGRSFPTWERG